jgi:hypothetical protein
LLHGKEPERRSKVAMGDFVNNSIKASYIVPIKISDKVNGQHALPEPGGIV